MTARGELEETAEELFEDAPCGYLATDLEGTILRVNRTFESWTGLRREDLIGARRWQQLLTAGGQIYHETHYAPLLQMQGTVREIAVDIVRADGTRLPALVNSVLQHDREGRPRFIRTTIFDATDRRRYEQELLDARRREQDIALQLQRSMLAANLPADDRLDVGVAYRPAVSGLEIGGDFYDAFWLEDGKTAGLVVGDVVGRGITAAATMGQLRSAVRALASVDPSPAQLLDNLDGFCRRHEIGRMTTVVYAQMDVAEHEVRFACAGHPPPLLTRAGTEPAYAWEGRSPPLDAVAGTGQRRPEAVCALPPGSTLLLYSDGLVERRDESIDVGMERLRRAAAATREGITSHELAASLVRELDDRGHRDDVCLLAAQVPR